MITCSHILLFFRFQKVIGKQNIINLSGEIPW